MVVYGHADGTAAKSFASRLVDLYAVVYREPPYEEGPEQVDRFGKAFDEERLKPGFDLVVALEGNDLVGAAYGWTMPAGRSGRSHKPSWNGDR